VTFRRAWDGFGLCQASVPIFVGELGTQLELWAHHTAAHMLFRRATVSFDVESAADPDLCFEGFVPADCDGSSQHVYFTESQAALVLLTEEVNKNIFYWEYIGGINLHCTGNPDKPIHLSWMPGCIQYAVVFFTFPFGRVMTLYVTAPQAYITVQDAATGRREVVVAYDLSSLLTL